MTAEKLHDAISLLPSDLIAEADKIRTRKPTVILWKRYAAMAACFVLVLGSAWFVSAVLMPKGGSTETAMQQIADAEPAEAPAAAAPIYEEAPAAEAAPEEAPIWDESNNTSGSGTITEDSLCELPKESRYDPACSLSRRVETPLKPSTACFSSTTVTLIHSPAELETYLSEKDWIYDFTNFPAACEDYDENWFAEHDLLLLTVRAAYPDIPYAVTSIENTDGQDPMGWDWYVVYASVGEDHPEGETTCFHLLTELEKGMISPEDSILTIADMVY